MLTQKDESAGGVAGSPERRGRARSRPTWLRGCAYSLKDIWRGMLRWGAAALGVKITHGAIERRMRALAALSAEEAGLERGNVS